MKIDTKNIKLYAKVLSALEEKGNQIYESLYLDFKNKIIRFRSSQGQGYLEIEVLDVSPNIQNFFVPTEKFLNIAINNDELEVLEDYSFKVGKDKYQLGYLVDDTIYPTFKPLESENLIKISDSDLAKLAIASPFIEKDMLEYKGLFFNQGYIEAMNRATPAFEIEADIKDNFKLTSFCIQVFQALGSDFEFEANERKIIIKTDDIGLELANNSNLTFPPLREKSFITRNCVPTKFKIDTKVIAQVLNFLSIYYKEIIGNVISFDLGEEPKIVVSNPIRNIKIEKELTNIEIDDELSGYIFNVSGEKLLKSIKIFSTSKFINIHTLTDNPTLDIKGDDDSFGHIILSKMKVD